MAGKPTPQQEAARKQYEAAPVHAKPPASQLAKDNGLTEIGIYKSAWWKKRNAVPAAQQSEGE